MMGNMIYTLVFQTTRIGIVHPHSGFDKNGWVTMMGIMIYILGVFPDGNRTFPFWTSYKWKIVTTGIMIYILVFHKNQDRNSTFPFWTW